MTRARQTVRASILAPDRALRPGASTARRLFLTGFFVFMAFQPGEAGASDPRDPAGLRSNEDEPSSQLRVAPPWWAAAWFRILIAAVVTGALVKAYRWRVRTLERQRRALEMGIVERRQVEAALRESRDQIRDLAGRLLTAQEEERRRIARDLHDDVGQRLSLLAIQAEELRRASGRSERGLDDRARDLAATAQELASDVHRIAYELHPARLETLGLAAAVRRLAEELRERHGLAVDVVEADWPRDVQVPLALCLYRITQEALWNVIRHSGVRAARVVLEGTPDSLTVTIADEGAGFAMSAGHADGGLGLTGMRERLRLVAGVLTVDTRPGRGTRIRARAPRETSPAGTVVPEPAREHADADASRPAG